MVNDPPTHRDIKLRDGRTLAFAEHGDPQGKPIVHCHGSPSSRLEGALIFDAAILSELGVRVIVPDRPGIGRSEFQAGRRIVDWPTDVLDLANALRLDKFVVVGESGGGPYATACGALIPDRVLAIGLVGAVAPLEEPALMAALNGVLRTMFRLARSAPSIVRALLRLNLRAMQSGSARGGERMAASFPEPDKSLLMRPEIRDSFMACFQEACRHGPKGPVFDMGLIARPWGFDLAKISVPAFLWHGERDGNVPVSHGRYMASKIPSCRAMFYPNEAHLSVPLNYQREILTALL